MKKISYLFSLLNAIIKAQFKTKRAHEHRVYARYYLDEILKE